MLEFSCWGAWRVVAIAGCWLGGCNFAGPIHTPEEEVRYAAEEARLFDDQFRPELFGLEESSHAPEQDEYLARRAESADSVFPAKVITLTRGGTDERAAYRVLVYPTEQALAGRAVNDPVTLEVSDDNPAFRWLDGAGSEWVGTLLVVFLRSYSDGAVHFHGTVDTPAVRQAISLVATPDTGMR